jgi:hypothetical protein
MPGEQWWVILDADGKPFSEGSVVANPLPEGRAKVKVDGPSDGRPWDPDAKAWGEAPEPTPDPLTVIAAIAADDTKTPEQRVEEIAAIAAGA